MEHKGLAATARVPSIPAIGDCRNASQRGGVCAAPDDARPSYAAVVRRAADADDQPTLDRLRLQGGLDLDAF